MYIARPRSLQQLCLSFLSRLRLDLYSSGLPVGVNTATFSRKAWQDKKCSATETITATYLSWLAMPHCMLGAALPEAPHDPCQHRELHFAKSCKYILQIHLAFTEMLSLLSRSLPHHRYHLTARVKSQPSHLDAQISTSALIC